MIKIRDLIAAEEALEAAEAESRKLSHDTSTWSAFESMDKRGRRTLNILPAQFARQEDAANKVKAAHQQLLATKRAFLEGVLPDAEV